MWLQGFSIVCSHREAYMDMDGGNAHTAGTRQILADAAGVTQTSSCVNICLPVKIFKL